MLKPVVVAPFLLLPAGFSHLVAADDPAAGLSEGSPTAAADSHASGEAPPGRDQTVSEPFLAVVATGDRRRTFDSPTRAMSELRRASSLKRRAGKSGSVNFRAVVSINGGDYEFSDPDAALEACQSVLEALRRLSRVRADLADVGTIPRVEDDADPGDDAQRNREAAASGLQTVRQRINQALHRELLNNRGRVSNPNRFREIVAHEVDRARSEGLLPASDAAESGGPGSSGNPPGPADRRTAEIEFVRDMLGYAFRKATDKKADAGVVDRVEVAGEVAEEN